MSKSEVTTKILSALEHGQGHRTLRALAKEAGFQSAASILFKRAFNSLIEEGIISLHKGGWTSERGNGNHQDGAVLISKIYRYDGDNYRQEKEIPIELELGSTYNTIKDLGRDGNSHPCRKCKDYENLYSEQYGTCKRMGWGIDKKLAMHHRLCSY